MPDFDGANPPKKHTDPKGSAGAPYPKHLHKLVSKPTKTSIAVAYDGDDAILNEYVVVNSPEEEAAAVAKGYADAPVLKAAAKK